MKSKHDFYLVSIGHYDTMHDRYLLPLKVYSTLSGAKRFVEKRRSSLKLFELDFFTIHKIDFDLGDTFHDVWYQDHGEKWIHGYDEVKK